MTARGCWVVVVALLAAGCSARRERPPGPPPEYERPRVTAWDSGAPVDPLGDIKGEEVTDDEPVPDAGATSADAGGAPEAGASAAPDPG